MLIGHSLLLDGTRGLVGETGSVTSHPCVMGLWLRTQRNQGC